MASEVITCIPQTRRKLHVRSEVVALAVVAPFMAYLAVNKSLPKWARSLAAAVGVGTVLVDGYLLLKFMEDGK